MLSSNSPPGKDDIIEYWPFGREWVEAYGSEPGRYADNPVPPSQH
jgi:hypothetical protein